MQAIVLVGGQGTRLAGLFPGLPKALAPVAGQPFLQRQIAWLAGAGIAEIHLAAGYKAERVTAWLDGTATTDPSKIGRWLLNVGRSAFSVHTTLSAEPAPLGTAGGLKFAQPHIRTDPFLVLNGDSVLPGLDFAAFQQAHKQTSPLASIAVTHIRGTGRYGAIEFDGQNRVLAFQEKTEREQGWVNAGVYLMDRQVLELIEPGKAQSLETGLFPRLAAQDRLRAFPAPPPLLDMGTPGGLAAMEAYFAAQG